MASSLRRLGVLSVICLALAAAASAVPGKKEASPPSFHSVSRSAFLTGRRLVDVQLSPTGATLAFLRREGMSQSLWLLDVASGRRRQIARRTEGTSLRWSSDSQWLFLQSQRSISAVPVQSPQGARVLTLLGGDSGRSVLGLDRSRPAGILVREEVRRPGERRVSSYRVLRLVPSQAPHLLMTSRDPIDEYIPGIIGFARTTVGDHFAIRRIDPSGTSKDVVHCVRLERCSILSSPRPGELLMRGDVGGDLERLIHMDASGRLTTLHQDPLGISDLAGVALDPLSGEALLASYRSAAGADYAVNPRITRSVASVRNQLPEGATFQIQIGRAHWLVAETGHRLQHARWHIFDVRSQRLREVLADVEATARRVPPAATAERMPISYRASDGMLLHGFLTLPNGRRPSQVPLLVNVHGGPWSHVADGYSTFTQFLASRGYAVFEPNFRGSTGYGREYMFAAGTDYGNGRVQADVTDGTHYLLGQGIGDPRRVGIIGSSFGGYSALLGATFSPDLFGLAIAAMPLPDFGWVLGWQLEREAANPGAGISLYDSLKHLGIDPDNPGIRKTLSHQSPTANVTRLRAPVLIVAGGKDSSVPIRSITDYSARLEAAGKRVTLFVDPKSGHRIEDLVVQDQFLYLVATLLNKRFGGRKEPSLNGPSRAKLHHKLRLDDLRLGENNE